MVLLVVAAVVAVVDWWSVGVGRRSVEILTKPGTMLVLAGVAATWGDPPADVRTALVVGAVFGLVGDAALLRPGTVPFLVGLSSFAVGHIAYVGAAVASGQDRSWMLPGIAFVVVLLGFRFATQFVAGAYRSGGAVMAGAVVFYAVVISAMSVTVWGSGSVVAGLGAVAFGTSDWLIGHDRFVGPAPGGRLLVRIVYHLGQAALIVGLTTG